MFCFPVSIMSNTIENSLVDFLIKQNRIPVTLFVHILSIHLLVINTGDAGLWHPLYFKHNPPVLKNLESATNTNHQQSSSCHLIWSATQLLVGLEICIWPQHYWPSNRLWLRANFPIAYASSGIRYLWIYS